MIYFFILFAVIPLLELTILIRVGTLIGVLNTIALLLITGFVGTYLARRQGFLVLQKIQQRQAEGLMPTEEMLDGLLLLIGGILFAIPGFLTDIVALFLIFPWTRALIKLILKKQFATKIKQHTITGFSRSSSFGNDRYTDIDI